jgi:transcriptional regulator with XRE-family HTH domain
MAKARLRTTFGRRLRELRRARGISLETLGERADVNDKYVQAVETGRQSPTLDVVEKLSAARSGSQHRRAIRDAAPSGALCVIPLTGYPLERIF